jgi:glycosyltransferase involved in cell wall biosynthesis
VPAALAGRLLQRQPYIICTDVTPRQYDQMAAEYAHTVDGQGPLARYKHWVNTKVLNGAARLLPWSTWAGVSLSTDYGVDRRRIEVVHPGVDLARWSPRSRTPAANPVRILFVGGHFERKGGDLLLQAFRALPAKAAELVVVSRTLLPKEEGVHVHCNLTPNSSELIQLFQSCDLFVLPTRAEAFGIAAVEAAATGLPIIATRVGGLSDIVQHGETGFLINGNDYDALQVHLLQLVQDPALRRQMGEKARAHALTHFDAQKNAARISQIIQEAASL